MKSGNILLFLLLCLFNSDIVFAQQLTTNENGEKIIVFSDGSWKYADAEDIAKYESDTQTGSDLLADSKKKELKSDLDIAIEISEISAAVLKDAIKEEENAKYKRILVEDELNDAEDNDEYFEEELKEIRATLKEAKKTEKKARAFRKEAEKRAKAAQQLMTMSPEQRAKEIRKNPLYDSIAGSSTTSDVQEVDMFPTDRTAKDEPDNSSGNSWDRVKSNMNQSKPGSFVKYDPAQDVMLNPPKAKCELSFDGVDEFSGKKRRDVQKQLFFTYTNEELRSVFKEEDYLICQGYLSSLSGGLTFLTLNIKINSKSAQREYGILEKGSLINIKLLNGDNVKMVNSKTNMGVENPLEGSVSYRAQYLISSGDEKKLKKNEVDKVRIIWSSGYEDYEIYELDFFINQFACLEGKG